LPGFERTHVVEPTLTQLVGRLWWGDDWNRAVELPFDELIEVVGVKMREIHGWQIAELGGGIFQSGGVDAVPDRHRSPQ
jgi:hypothetical protein